MNQIRSLVAILLTAVMLVFAMQNLRAVPVEFLKWEFRVSVALVAMGPFLVGLVVGTVTGIFRGRRAQRAKQIAASEQAGRLGGSSPSVEQKEPKRP